MLQLSQLKSIMPQGLHTAAFLAPLNQAMAHYAINTPKRIAAFLAQVAHESGQLNLLVENTNYSAESLLQIFPHYFNHAEAAKYAHKPEAIANRVYADRMGNGPEKSGDGYRYRGRGALQTTGRDSYHKCGLAIGLDLVAHPERLEEPLHAAMAAGSYWNHRDCSPMADKGDFKSITKAINGGFNGLADREHFWTRAKEALGVK